MATNSEATDFKTGFTKGYSRRNRMVFKNNFGWSISRESLFDSCKRAYYFHYYLSWGGWNRNAPEDSRRAFKLKRLVSLPLWRGQLVHYIATKILQSTRSKKRIPAEDDVTSYTIESFNKQLNFSKEKRYRYEPKKIRGKLHTNWLALRDHEYGIDIPPRHIEKTRGECLKAIKALLESPILDKISKTDSSKWVIEDIDFSEFAQSFQFEKTTIFLKTDFMFRSNDGTFNIVDWKTFADNPPSSKKRDLGRAGDQLGIYGYYATAILGEPIGNIKMYEINLLDAAREVVYTINKKSIERATKRINKGIAKLASVLTDNDTEKNNPLTYQYFPPNRGNKCKFCNFSIICDE
ncbi:PD-(D/E)XK nuclease family protein [bacterium]|nr:PD-(D/E)XK nuclease family protein [bacterium]